MDFKPIANIACAAGTCSARTVVGLMMTSSAADSPFARTRC
jgi:hypothetical protein